MKKIAAAYVRVSTGKQDEYSPASQLQLVREYADRNGYYIPDEYVYYDDGISGKSTAKRSQFNDMIYLGEKKNPPFSAIIVWKFSRFARNEEDSIVLKGRLRRNGVAVLSASEHIDQNNEYSSLIERFIEFDDAHYLTRLSQEVKRGMAEAARQGKALVPPPVGYDMINKKYIPNADAELVKSVFERYASGEPYTTIAKSLSADGVKTKFGNPPDNRYIKYMLTNPLYIGKIRWSTAGRKSADRAWDKETTILADGEHEPIISQELWDAVQARFEKNLNIYGKWQRPEQSYDWMLKGMVRCDVCGGTLTRSKCCGITSMQCHNYARGQCLVSHYLPIQKANEAVVAALKDAVTQMSFKLDTKPLPKTSINYDKMIAQEKNRLSRAKAAYQAGVDTLDEYRQTKQAIEANIAEIETKIAESANIPEFNAERYKDKVVKVIDYITSTHAKESEKSKALRSILSKIVYVKSKNCIEIFFC